MDLKYLGIFVAILVVDSSVAEVDPTLVIKYKKLEATIADNSYFGYVTTEISGNGELASTKFSLKKPLPDDAKISVTTELEGEQIADYEDLVCEAMKNEVYTEDMYNYGLPKDEYPKECPVTSGVFEVRKYPIPKDQFPAGTPPGDYNGKLAIGEPDQDPWVVIDAVIEVSHNAPGVPAPGLG